MALLNQSTAYNRAFLMVQSSDHVTGITGSTGSLAVTLSKNGGAFAAAGGALSEIGNGWYKIALTTADTGTAGDLAYHCTATSADPTDFVDQIGQTGTAISSNVKKNQALSNFPFQMTKVSDHTPAPGLGVISQISKDGAAYVVTTNAVTELSNGTYLINFTQSEMNANCISLRFTAANADDLILSIITQP